MTFIAIPLAALLIGQPSIGPLSRISPLSPSVDPPKIPRSEVPPVATLGSGGGRIFFVIAVIRAAAVVPPPSDPSYLGVVGVDRDGRPLDGTHRYRLHFAKDELPPGDALWSLTALENDPFRSGAEAEEGMLGQGDDLHYNADHSLDIYLQRDEPPAGQRMNWLRIPSGPFNLVAHARWPGATDVKGEWKVPSVKRVD